MPFSYDPTTLTAPLNKIRKLIPDKVEGRGPGPEGANFDDDEILDFYTDEGSSINAAVAAALENLASDWASFALSERAGEVSFDAKEVSDTFADRAAEWRQKPGGGDGAKSARFRVD